MLFITDNEFHRFVSTSRNRFLAKNLYDQGRVVRIHIDQDSTGNYKVQGLVLVNEISYYPVIYINHANKIMSASCSCTYSDEFTICAHVGAVILALQNLLPDHFPYDYRINYKALREKRDAEERARNKARQRQQEEYRRQMEVARRRAFEKTTTELTAAVRSAMAETFQPTDPRPVNLVIQGAIRRGYLHLRLKIGRDQMYLIKNINTFLSDVASEEYRSYGKKFAWRHRYEGFSESAKQIYDFVVKANALPAEGYHQVDEISLPESMFDSFFALCQKMPECIQDLQVEREKMIIQLSIREDADDMILSIESRYGTVSIGKKDCYEIENNRIRVLEGDDQGILMRLLQAFITDRGTLYIAKSSFNEFYRYIMAPIKDHLTIIGQVPEGSYEEEDRIEIYGDIDEDEVAIFDVYGIYGEERKNMLEEPDAPHSVMMDMVIDYMKEFNADQDGHHLYMDTNKEETLDFLTDGISFLTKYADVFVSENLKKLGTKTQMKFNVGISVTADKLMAIDFEAFDFPIEELAAILNSYKKKKKYYKLKNGELLYIQSEGLEELNKMMDDYHIQPKDIKDGHLEMNMARAYALNDSLSDMKYTNVSRSETFKETIDRLENYHGNVYPLDPHYDEILRDYQKDGYQWLSTMNDLNLGGVLADDMGLGKTLQMISLIASQEHRHTIVVCPASLILNWQDEIRKFGAQLKSVCVMGSVDSRKQIIRNHRMYDVLITSYDYIRRDVDLYKKIVFDFIVLDEAQYIKNQTTKNAQSVKKLKGRQRFALTGTPIENSLAELWSIFDFLNKDYLFNYNYFRRQYESPIVKSGDPKKQAALKKLVSPFILRRTKSDVLKELPEKVEKTISISFNENETKLYAAQLYQANRLLDTIDTKSDKIAIFAMLTRLRQICCEPRLLFKDIEEKSSKMEACLDIIDNYRENHKKLIVFSSFTSVLDLLADELDEQHIFYHMLTGATPKEKRKEMIDAYQNDNSTVFLISLKAGGTGLNLTAAEGVVHYDPWWNMSAQMQATDRAHRIGQENTVFVYKLIMENSIEEKIQRMQEAKKDLADTFVEDNDNLISRMSAEELRALFQ